jgi:hypothetical protein
MVNITPEEITRFREELSVDPDAMKALDAIEQCQGNLEAAVKLIAIEQLDEEIDTRTGEDYLNKLVEQCRRVVCQDEFVNDLMSGLLIAAVGYLSASGVIPAVLVTPVVIYLAKIGVRQFCQSQQKH